MSVSGLCRSCEVFGVSELAVSSLMLLEDSQFQGLSVSAHKWINITQVRNYPSFLVVSFPLFHFYDFICRTKNWIKIPGVFWAYHGHARLHTHTYTHTHTEKPQGFPLASILGRST